MKTKTSILLFILAGLFLTATFFVTQKILASRNTAVTRAKVVNPKNADSQNAETDLSNIESQVEKFDTLITLKPTETLISSLTIDLNADTYDDEVVVIRKASERNLVILSALYNPETAEYYRIKEISTEIESTKTFTLMGMDMIGSHQNALIYQGMDDHENTIMKIYMCEQGEEGMELVQIGNFISDGTIFISQTERSEAYELSLAKGASYSVWVYKSDLFGNNTETDPSKALNQIQQEYKWNNLSKKYELSQEIKVAASRLEAAELSKIQDGTVESFASFLDGLWYKTSNVDSNFRYFFFDYKNREIIQFLGDKQEIYQWEISRLRHNGIYISTVNSSITNLHRRIDIGLMGMDQIKITTWDDVNLVIKEDNLWDGTYKRLSVQTAFEDKQEVLSDFEVELEKGNVWTSSDGMMSISCKDSVYLLKLENIDESGIYSFLKAGGYDVIQFRSNNDSSMIKPSYAMEFGKKTVTVRNKERVVQDNDTIILTPVSISPLDCFAAEGQILTFTRQQ